MSLYIGTKRVSPTINSVTSSTVNTQTKTVSPTESSQTVAPDEGYYLSSVTVNAIDSSYVGSEITRRTASDITTYENGKYIKVPNGYYKSLSFDFSVKEASSLDSNLSSENIKNGVTIFGVEGSYEGDSSPLQLALDTVTSITYPSGTTTIPADSLYNKKAITSVTIPETVTEVGSYAFASCSNLETLVFPTSVKYLNKSVFEYTKYYNNKLKKYYSDWTEASSSTDDNVLKVIDDRFLIGCDDNFSTSSLTVPSNIEFIGEDAFFNENSVKGTLTINSKSIGKYAFCGTGITSLILNSGVKYIGGSAFALCGSLSSVTLSDTLIEIGSDAFYGCTLLSTINYSGTMEEWNAITKGSDWNRNIPATEVTCSDGTVTL